MQNNVSATVYHNCAVELQYNGETLLADFLSKGREPFDGINKEVLNEVFSGEDGFKNVRCLIYTHSHPDHFDEKLNERYLKENNVPLIIPQSGSPWGGSFSIGAFKISFHAICHSGEEYKDVINYVYLVKMGEKSVYISGDADFNSAEHAAFLNGFKPDIALLNPFYLSAKRNIINEIGAKRTYIYHIPSKDDEFLIKSTAKAALNNNKELNGRCFLISKTPLKIML